jgi:Helitron helicase-like domain at N-terminus
MQPSVHTDSAQPAPTIGAAVGEPVSEFNTDYLTLSFPHLYETGAAPFHVETPCEVEIKSAEYFESMIRYHDGRFACDKKFLFAALNFVLRQKATAQSKVFVKQAQFDPSMTVEQLDNLETPEQLDTFAHRVCRWAEVVEGTRAYWQARLQELRAMCHQLGCPGAFLSASAADVQWPGMAAVFKAAGLGTDSDMANEKAHGAWQNKCLIETPQCVRSLFGLFG